MKPPTLKTRPRQILHGIALSVALVCTCAAAEPSADIDALEAAAQRGEAPALVRLAARYERGDGVEKNFVKSNELYCKAAARGDGDALLRMGQVYAAGREVLADEAVAAFLIRRAAEQGNEEAAKLLDYVSRRPVGTLPACLTEAAASPDATLTVVNGRRDIEALVQRLAPEYSVDPNLVMALITTESNFDTRAVSPKNAQGLMQLIPATAERFGVKNVYDPVQNLKGGLAYLQWLMAFFKGEVALVLAAYNAGEEAVERFRGIPPYKETRNYVKQITRVYKSATHPYIAELVAPSVMMSGTRRRIAD